MKYILATHNQNKVIEINHLLTGTDIEMRSLKDINYNYEIIENGASLEENAFIKADAIFKHISFPAIGEDTGLEVEALNGAPGVVTARYGGNEKNADLNMEKLLTELRGFSNRRARFRTCLALVTEDKRTLFEGIVEGRIAEAKRGNGGFGYDPIFIPDGYDKTFAEIPLEEKSKISHRSRAIKKLLQFLNSDHNR